MIYFLFIVHVQNIAIVILRVEGDTNKMSVDSHIEVIVLYELLIFYFTIFGLMAFLLFSRFFSFRTMRERLELGGNMRYRRDFLEFVQEDIHYTLIAITEILLFIYVITHLTTAITLWAAISMGLISFHQLCQFFMIFFVYFRPLKSRVSTQMLHRIVLSYMALTISLMIYICFMLYVEQKRRYWYPYLMVYLFMKFSIVCNIVFE